MLYTFICFLKGSAADIIKIAMINLYSVIAGFNTCNSTDALATKFSMLKGHCHILLQVCIKY